MTFPEDNRNAEWFRRMLDAERSDDDAIAPASRAELWNKLHPRIHQAPAFPMNIAKRALFGKLTTAIGFALGVGTGVAGVTITRTPRAHVAQSIAPIRIEVATHPAPQHIVAPAVPNPIAPASDAGTHTSSNVTATINRNDAVAERAALDTARTALLRGRTEQALAALRSAANRFPNGELTEERDALRVEALVAAGSYAEARVRAATFLREYPGSLQRSAVAEAVRSIP